MASAPVIEPGQRPLARPQQPRSVVPSRPPRSWPGAAAGACVALLALTLYAAFDHGAFSLAGSTRVELVLAAIALVAGPAWVWTGRLRVLPRSALIGIGLLATFAAWSAVTLLWSVSPNQTWIEFNRVAGYVVVVSLAVAVGAFYMRAIELAALGFLAVAAVVTAYALGQKLVPGLHVSGVFDLNQSGPLPRLQEPLGYWNALALFIALAVPVALALAADGARRSGVRLAAACGLTLMLVTIVFTYSRGGLVAVAIGLVCGCVVCRQRLRWLIWLGSAAVAGVPAVAVGLSWSRLTDVGVSLSARQGAGAVLIGVLIVSLAGLVFGGRRLIGVEPRLRVDPVRASGLRRLALAAGAVVVVGVVVALALSSRGLPGTFSHAWHTFTTARSTSNYDPHHLLSADSQNRWVWWKEAVGSFSDRPLQGWGSGSFGVVHLLYRRNTLPVQQPHSVPLQFLSETGLVGALLALGAFFVLTRAAARAVRELRGGGERLLGAALLAGVVAYEVHCLYDWGWDIPAVTLPALLFLGVLVGSAARRRQRRLSLDRSAFDPAALGLRSVGLAGLTLLVCAFGLSAELPELAASKTSGALVQAAGGAPAQLAAAQSAAAEAAKLDPVSDAGLSAQSTIALHRGDLGLARMYLQQAVAREPTDGGAWDLLAYVDGLVGDRRGETMAFTRVLRLDPRGKLAAGIVRGRLGLAPPAGSATAIPTPLGQS